MNINCIILYLYPGDFQWESKLLCVLQKGTLYSDKITQVFTTKGKCTSTTKKIRMKYLILTLLYTK